MDTHHDFHRLGLFTMRFEPCNIREMYSMCFPSFHELDESYNVTTYVEYDPLQHCMQRLDASVVDRDVLGYLGKHYQ